VSCPTCKNGGVLHTDAYQLVRICMQKWSLHLIMKKAMMNEEFVKKCSRKSVSRKKYIKCSTIVSSEIENWRGLAKQKSGRHVAKYLG